MSVNQTTPLINTGLTAFFSLVKRCLFKGTVASSVVDPSDPYESRVAPKMTVVFKSNIFYVKMRSLKEI
jgi:hypothetical protein